jgi:hypothetical protein
MNPPLGLKPLVVCRLRGKLPSRNILLLIGDEWNDPDWSRWIETMPYPEGVIRTSDKIDRIDFRCLVGLSVFIHSARFTALVAKAVEAVQLFADYTLLTIEDIGGDAEFIEWRRA